MAASFSFAAKREEKKYLQITSQLAAFD